MVLLIIYKINKGYLGFLVIRLASNKFIKALINLKKFPIISGIIYIFINNSYYKKQTIILNSRKLIDKFDLYMRTQNSFHPTLRESTMIISCCSQLYLIGLLFGLKII